MDKQLAYALRKCMTRHDYENALKCLYSGYDKSNKFYEKVVKLREAIIEDLRGDYNPVKGMEFLKESYRLTGKDRFDDFMIFIEWNRPNREKFWLPRREQLKDLCEALQDLWDGKIDELFINLPPRVGKTTIVTFYILWAMLKNPEASNLYCSYTDSVVLSFYNGVLEILNDADNYIWREMYPKRRIAGTNAQEHRLNIQRSRKYASLTCRSLYGSLNGACDCNGIIIADDLHSGIEEAMNKDLLNKAWYRVDNNLLTRAKMGARRLWVGTRWSIADATGRMLDLLENDEKFKNRKFRVINRPALDENDESNFNYKFGVGYDTEYYLQRRASFERNNDIASWEAQYQGEPVERDGSVFRPEDMRYFNGVLPDSEPDRVFTCVDPAWGGGDYTAAPIVYQYGDDLFVADVIYNNGDKSITQALIVNKAKEHNLNAIYIEATRVTSSYAEGVSQKLSRENLAINVQTSIKHFTQNGKQMRIFDKAPDIREKMIFLDKGRSKEYQAFMNNVFAFSVLGKNKHDDAPDSLAMTISNAFFVNNKLKIQKRVF